ncbi:MAG: hypothetical protein AAF830_14930 [Pseudomonadota bacterium]
MRSLFLAIGFGALAACATTTDNPRFAGTSFAAVDVDGNGSLTRDELSGVDVSFTRLDRNNDDAVSIEEINAYNTATSASRARSRNASTGSRL